MKRVQHKESTARKKKNSMKIAQFEQRVTRKKANMKRVHLEKNHEENSAI